ncbi:MAG TPA: GNAT family N-acetyltransferase [Puia sp.]|nr:GNAT family N-acetyltransferase [Puia sp.]
MNVTLSLRFADIHDISTIGFLAQQIWPYTYKNILSADQLNYMMDLFYSPSSLKKQMKEEKHTFVLIEDSEGSLGFASFSKISASGIYKLHKIYVLPALQGKGIGKAMIDFIIEHIKPIGGTALQLNVNRHNKARSFYERLGFSVIHEEDIDIGNNFFMNDYVMEKKIQ